MYRVLVFALALALLSGPSQGQVPVTDAGAAGQRLVLIGKAVLSVAEAVAQTKLMLQELLPLDDITLAAEFVETMQLLGEIAAEGQALMQDAETAARQFQALFGLDALPTTPSAIQQRIDETTALLWEARRFAACTQTLISVVTDAASHATRLVQLVGGIVGNTQGNQLQVQFLAQISQTLSTLTLQQAADQHVRTVEGAARDVIVRSLANMQAARWEGWPTRRGDLH